MSENQMRFLTVFSPSATVSCHPPSLLFACRLFLFRIFSKCCFLSGYTFVKGLIQENIVRDIQLASQISFLSSLLSVTQLSSPPPPQTLVFPQSSPLVSSFPHPVPPPSTWNTSLSLLTQFTFCLCNHPHVFRLPICNIETSTIGFCQTKINLR